ncbi:MAG: mechanosensitive ion channel [Ignavibacteriae bacterium]|nr:mechanosensitive ion channel family protein [Ignavibacteriota bacterium]NOG96489.1 mechanosensitive ion channel [Ignavibacteriota bacterium]
MEDILKQIETVVATYGLNIVAAIVILIVGLWLAKIISKSVVKMMLKKNVDATLTNFLGSIVKIGIIAFVVMAVISKLGIETTSFVAVIGAIGLAIGFALQGSLSNIAAGVMIIIFRQIKVGDFIEGGGSVGSVETVGIFSTTLTTPDNKVIYVPNSKLVGDNIVNYSVKDTRRVDMVFGIGYSDDIDKAKTVINRVLNSNDKVLKDPAPLVVVTELADSSVNFNVRPWVNAADYWGVYFYCHEEIKKQFDAENISIPFPQTDVHIHQN